ncbi:MAG TPA: GNAT family N-acetyltransferase [Vicinamibacteria bacterium]
MSVLTREMTEADLDGGLRLSRASGWNQALDDWRLLLSLGPGLFRVAVSDGRIVATGGAVRYGRDLAWICMILVDPAERGHGLGTRIFDEVLDRTRRLRDAGELQAIGLDATPLGLGIYLQRGFVGVASREPDAGSGESKSRPGAGPDLLRMRVEPPIPPADAPTRGVALLSPGDLDGVLALDRAVFGADRSAVLRWALAKAPGLAYVAREGSRVRGYCFGRHGDHSDHVGPVVAEDAALARDLVASCLSIGRRRPVILDARSEPRWLSSLAALGFREQRPLTRLYLDEARPEASPALEPVILGPEFG